MLLAMGLRTTESSGGAPKGRIRTAPRNRGAFGGGRVERNKLKSRLAMFLLAGCEVRDWRNERARSALTFNF